MDYISEIKNAKTLEDLYKLEVRLSDIIEAGRCDADREYSDAIVYRGRVVSQINYLEANGFFLNDVGKDLQKHT